MTVVQPVTLDQLPEAFRACIRNIRANSDCAHLQVDPHKWMDLRALLILSGATIVCGPPDYFTTADQTIWICNKRQVSAWALLRHLQQ